jgi:MSHA biogenesis protein MshO
MRVRGFTLIELVIVIAVGAVVVSFMALFIVRPVQAYGDQTRRAELVDAADSALQFMSRDLRSSLPNSVRIASNGSIVALELLNTLDGARYRDSGPLSDAAAELDFSAADAAFATTTPFTRLTLPYDSTSSYLSIYNVGVPGADAYEQANVITPTGTRIQISASGTPGDTRVTLSPAFKFGYGSPGKRVYLVEGPVTYLCDTAAGTLMRYSGYTLASNQSNRDTAAELTGAGAAVARVAGDIGGCNFNYDPGTPQRAGLVTLQLTVSRQGESVQLLQQVHLVNSP